MANSTFSGPVRSENGFKIVSKGSTTGLISDRTVHEFGIKDTRRYYLEEYFNQLPALNAYLQGSETKDWGSIADDTELEEDVTVTGAALGDFAVASMGVDTVAAQLTASVTAADTVTVVISNVSGGAIDLASQTLSVKVFKAGSTAVGKSVNFEVLGTNMTTALATRNATVAAVTLTTAGADQDQAILAPHLDSGQTAWTGVKWGTENQVTWEALVRTSSAIDNQKIWAGLKLTNDQVVATDANQAFFKFQTDSTNSEAFTDFNKLHFVHSVGNTDYISRLPIDIAASTNYHLKIVMNSDRKLTIYVNGVQYNITGTSGSTGGTAVTAVEPGKQVTLSGAMTNDIDLIPYVGIEAGDGAAAAIDVSYCTISRLLFE